MPGSRDNHPLIRTLQRTLFLGAALPALAFAQSPQSQPDKPLDESTQQRASDLIAIIEGQNAPQARQTGARELLRLGRPDTTPRLAAILSGSNGPAKTAVAIVLARASKHLDPTYVEPLMGMLDDADAEVRRAAGAALAAYRDGGVLSQLRARVLDGRRSAQSRLAIVETLGEMTRRDAIGVLVQVLTGSDAAISKSALVAIERATGMNFGEDVAAAREWWEDTRELPLEEWQRLQIERLVQRKRETDRQLRTVQTRLTRALRDIYLQAPEANRAAILQGYLSDPSSVVQLVGMELVQSQRAEAKTPAPETVALVRKLLTSRDATVRGTAVHTAASFGDVADGEPFTQMLASEAVPAVRQALVNGLGYVGSAAAIEPLLTLVAESEDDLMQEAVTAVGRLAGRDVLDDAAREKVSAALLTAFAAAPRERAALRERVLWAMGRVGDPRFGPAFAEALNPVDDVTVRQAAVRGIAVLADPQWADALAPAVADADGVVRKTAVEAMAKLARTDAHLDALWGRIGPEQETDESIRQTAWRGVLTFLANHKPAFVEARIPLLPGNGDAKVQRSLELLQIAEKSLAGSADARGELGRVRARIAALHVGLNQADEAVAAYVAALKDLHAAGSKEIPRVAVELLRFVLVNNRYDEKIAAALAGANPKLDGRAVWDGIKSEIERRVTKDEVDRAIEMLAQLESLPPTSMPADVQAEMKALLERARTLKAEAEAPPPSSQPTTTTKSPP